MNKTVAIAFSLLIVTSGASAAVIPQNFTVDLNINLGGIFGGDDEKQAQEEENNTYGQRVNGQSVHTETRNNDPERQRNNDELRITEESSEKKDPLAQFFKNFFG